MNIIAVVGETTGEYMNTFGVIAKRVIMTAESELCPFCGNQKAFKNFSCNS